MISSCYGGPATEVARRAGHGVAVLLKTYAHCIDGQSDAANMRIPTPSASRTPGVPRRAVLAGKDPQVQFSRLDHRVVAVVQQRELRDCARR